MKKVDWYIFTGLYLSVLAYIIWYTLSHDVINADFGREYEVYLRELASGRWNYIPDSLVNASPISTYLPALLQRTFHLSDTTLFFKMTPAVIFAFLPPITYLICKKYTDRPIAVFAALFVFTHFYMNYAPEHGRVEIGWTLAALLMYALLNNKRVLAIVASAILPFSHYGAVFMLLPILAAAALIFRQKKPLVLISLGIIAVLGLIWYFLIAKATGIYALSFITHAFEKVPVDIITRNIFGIPTPNTFLPFVFAWVIILLIIWGFINTVWRKDTEKLFIVFAGCFIVYMILAFALPFVSQFYGIARVYFTAIPIFAVLIVKYVPLPHIINYGFLVILIFMHYKYCLWCPF